MSEMQEAKQAIELMFKTCNLILNVPVSASQIFINITQGSLKNDTILKALGKNLEKEIAQNNIDVTEINPEFFKNERGGLTINKVDYKNAMEAMNEITDELNKNGIFARAYIENEKLYILTHKSQREIVKSFMGKEISSSAYNIYSIKEIAEKSNHEVGTFKITGLNSNEKTLALIKRSQANNIPISVSETENGVFVIRYPKVDEVKMNRIKKDISIDFSGKAKNIIIDQLRWEDINTSKLVNKAINHEIEPGKCLIDRNGKYIEFNKNSVNIVYSDSTKKHIKYNDKDYINKITSLTGDMNGIVEVDKKDVENYLKLSKKLEKLEGKKPLILEDDTLEIIQKKKDNIKEIEKEQEKLKNEMDKMLNDKEYEAGRPKLSEEEIKILQRNEKERMLLNAKLSQDHPEEKVIDVDDYNSEQPYIVFKENELLNAKAVEELEAENNKTEVEEVDDRMLQADTLYKDMDDYRPEINIDDEVRIEEQIYEIENESREDFEINEEEQEL